jgi:hypothetical protein
MRLLVIKELILYIDHKSLLVCQGIVSPKARRMETPMRATLCRSSRWASSLWLFQWARRNDPEGEIDVEPRRKVQRVVFVKNARSVRREHAEACRAEE